MELAPFAATLAAMTLLGCQKPPPPEEPFTITVLWDTQLIAFEPGHEREAFEALSSLPLSNGRTLADDERLKRLAAEYAKSRAPVVVSFQFLLGTTSVPADGGVVIDARSRRLRHALSPALRSGTEVLYQGPVIYQEWNLDRAKRDPRVAPDPLVLRPARIDDCDVVLSDEDAARLRAMDGPLKAGRVVFLEEAHEEGWR